MLSAALIAAFVAGLAGSAHCFGMCGGFAGALGMHARRAGQSFATRALRALSYQFGRIGGYAALGAIGGAFGHSAHAVLDLTRFESVLRIAAGVLTILIAVRILWRWNSFARLERAAAKLWVKLQPLASRATSSRGLTGSVALGLLWGLLPCGLVYSMLLMTLTTASAAEGAAVMLAFGAGTLPAMAASSIMLGATWLRAGQQAWLRKGSGILLLSFGIWVIVAGQLPGIHLHHLQPHAY